MTTTAASSPSEPTTPDPILAPNATRLQGWVTADLERVLQRAVDIADAAGQQQVWIEHVALAILENPYSTARTAGSDAQTVTQWQQALIKVVAASHVEADQPRQVTDIFCWRSIRR
ncbi:hypothetical protein ACWDYH_17350 [Nocardia goodfellowii]